jgi:hypothetical protein
MLELYSWRRPVRLAVYGLLAAVQPLTPPKSASRT